MKFPLDMSKPNCLVAAIPSFFLCITRIRSSFFAKLSHICPESSVLPSSIKINSMS